MTDNDETRLLIRIAQLYYEKNMTQSEISKELGINRTTISRLLKKVRDLGIVTISINYDFGGSFTIEQKLKDRFGLRDVIVVPVESDQPNYVKLKAMGQACAKMLERIVEDNDVIGFSWGRSLAAVVDALESTSKKIDLCVPMVGGPSGKLNSKYHVNTICYNAADKFNTKSLMIDLPAIMENKEAHNHMINSQYFKEILDMWKQVSIAVVGIGSIKISKESMWHDFYGDAFIAELEDDKVAGDICSRFYDINGNLIQTSLTDKTITIELEQLKKARYTIGVAESHEKVSGIIGALNGGYINVLVTTEETAQEILVRTT